MALATYTLTGDLSKLLGDQYDYESTKAWIESSVGDDGVIYDRANNQLLLGDQAITLNRNGTFTVPGLVGFSNLGADVSPTGIQYRVWIVFPTARRRVLATWDSGWFGIDASTDLTDVAPDQYLPPDYQGEFMSRARALRDELAALRDETEALRDQAGALVVTDLGTSDGQVSTLIGTPGSATRAAVGAYVDAELMPLLVMGVI